MIKFILKNMFHSKDQFIKQNIGQINWKEGKKQKARL